MIVPGVGGVPGTQQLRLAAVVSIPLRTRFRGLRHRQLAIVRGPLGYAEFAPFREYADEEAASWWEATREAAVTGWPAPLRTQVPVNATVPAVPAASVAAVLARFPGCTTAKVKVAEPGQDPADDLDRLAATREFLGDGGKVRIDVNGAWSVSEALDLLPRYQRAARGLEYVEQPCPTVADLATVRRRSRVPVAADESVRRADDPLAVLAASAADVVVLKVAPLGGVRRCLRLAERLRESGVTAVVSSALESSIGLAAGVALAAALPDLPHHCGLGTGALLADDLTSEPLLPDNGAVPVRRPEVEPASLSRLAVGPDDEHWWRERAARVGGEARAEREQ